ncbi:MAG: hypothetical protein WED11_08225, partial [Natronospirillum sp.]
TMLVIGAYRSAEVTEPCTVISANTAVDESIVALSPRKSTFWERHTPQRQSQAVQHLDWLAYLSKMSSHWHNINQPLTLN